MFIGIAKLKNLNSRFASAALRGCDRLSTLTYSVQILKCVAIAGIGASLLSCGAGFSPNMNGLNLSSFGSGSASSFGEVSSVILPSVLSVGSPQKIVASASHGFNYAYAPSIIYTQGQYHAYFCSTGAGDNDWDHVRHVTSTDLKNWSAPDDVLQSIVHERANCDPSIVRFDGGDGLYYYLFYTGNAPKIQGLQFVSRSVSPDGPFLKLTDRGTWEQKPNDPHAIIWPIQNGGEDAASIYGSGQASVVSKNGILYLWHNDTTADLAHSANKIYLRTSTNAINWSNPQATNVGIPSIDVKYHPDTGQFVMFEILDEHTTSARLAIQNSIDGVTWSDSTIVCDQNCFPKWSNNVGVSGDDQGHLISGSQVLAAYGAPYDLNGGYNNDCKVAPSPLCWGHWDLYGTLLDIGFTPGTPSDAHDPTLTNFAMKSSSSQDELWPSSAVIDQNPQSVYSSQSFPTAANDRGTSLEAWLTNAPQAVKQILLTARALNGQVLGFPRRYDLFLTSPDNSSWQKVGFFSNQPNTDGIAVVSLPSEMVTYGVMIVPTVLGVDNYNVHYLQIAEMALAGRTSVAVGSLQKYPFASSFATEALWPSESAIDGNPGSVYSTQSFPSNSNSRAASLTAWFAVGNQTVTHLLLTARIDQGHVYCFPESYDIYVTSPDNSRWEVLGTFSNQPGSDGVATVPLGATYSTHGVMVVPHVLTKDNLGNYYFQLAEINLAGPQ